MRTKYPWIVKLHVEDPEKYMYQMTINFDVNLKRFVDMYDLHDSLKRRFDNDQSSLENFINFSCWSYMYSIVIGSNITQETDEDKLQYSSQLNEGIEGYMSFVYSKLPPDMVVKSFNGDLDTVEREAPYLYSTLMDRDESNIFEVKTLTVGCYNVIPESCRDLLGGV